MQAKGLTVVDANPRPSVIVDRIAFREGAEKLFSFADIAKISDEDADLLYREDAIDVVARLLSLGAGAVLFTHGEQGASIHTKQGLTVRVSIAEMPGPILDTMGAGDASLATVIAYILRQGVPQSAEAWRFCLDEAMGVAAATCRQMGGGLALPPH